MADPIEGRDVRKDLETGPLDAAQTLARVAAGLLPVVGSTAAELVNAVLEPVVRRRRDDWIIYLADGLEDLRKRLGNFDISDLAGNEQFVSAALQAGISAIRTHQQEKREALRNAVLNTARGIDIDESVQAMFLACVDELSPLHLGILKYFNDPRAWIARNHVTIPSYSAGGRSTVLKHCFPELVADRELASLVINTLHARGLLAGGADVMSVMVTARSMFDPLTTGLGKKFIKYISAPG